jgi:hypothetical protein
MTKDARTLSVSLVVFDSQPLLKPPSCFHKPAITFVTIDNGSVLWESVSSWLRINKVRPRSTNPRMFQKHFDLHNW